MADVVSQTNEKLIGFFTNFSGGGIMTFLGWAIFIIILVAGLGYVVYAYRNKGIWKKNITAFDIVGTFFEPAIRDKAKVTKIGKGGFEILYLKKQKTWKLAYGGRVGRNTYYFFIMPDGYWYNGMLSANILRIDKEGGLIPIVTTNPTMRSQYTSLEKQIDSIHKTEKSFMDKWGVWIFSIGFLLVAGVFLWLIAQQNASVVSANVGMTDKIATLIDKINMMMSNTQGIEGAGGLIKT